MANAKHRTDWDGGRLERAVREAATSVGTEGLAALLAHHFQSRVSPDGQVTVSVTIPGCDLAVINRVVQATAAALRGSVNVPRQ